MKTEGHPIVIKDKTLKKAIKNLWHLHEFLYMLDNMLEQDGIAILVNGDMLAESKDEDTPPC